MPNKTRIQKWVEALESGEFRQTREMLADKMHPDKPAYCCLGVACELAERDGVAHDWFNDVAESDTLPRPVQEWLGVDDCDPLVNIGWYPGDNKKEHLTVLNDNLEWTFPQIAKAVRDTFLTDV